LLFLTKEIHIVCKGQTYIHCSDWYYSD